MPTSTRTGRCCAPLEGAKAVAEAVAAAEAYAASQEGKAATAAEHERIMREIAAGGVPRL